MKKTNLANLLAKHGKGNTVLGKSVAGDATKSGVINYTKLSTEISDLSDKDKRSLKAMKFGDKTVQSKVDTALSNVATPKPAGARPKERY